MKYMERRPPAIRNLWIFTSTADYPTRGVTARRASHHARSRKEVTETDTCALVVRERTQTLLLRVSVMSPHMVCS